MRIIAVANQKGGVAKTTTAMYIASGLARRGYRVLAIDLDPQANLTMNCNAEMENEPTVYEMLRSEKGATVTNVIRHMTPFDILPANILLSGAEQEFNATGKEYRLKESIQPVVDAYDFIIIDTPPALGVLTINAFTAATDVLIPTLAASTAIRGIVQLNDTINTIRKYCNPDLNVLGIVFTNYESRTTLSRQLRDLGATMGREINCRVFNTPIRRTVKVKEAEALQKDLFDYDSKSTAAVDYNAFIDEMLAGIGMGKSAGKKNKRGGK